MDGPTPRAIKVIAGLGGVDGNLPEVFLPVLYALIEPAHHPKVVELRSFTEVGPIHHPFLDTEEEVERPRRRSGG